MIFMYAHYITYYLDCPTFKGPQKFAGILKGKNLIKSDLNTSKDSSDIIN